MAGGARMGAAGCGTADDPNILCEPRAEVVVGGHGECGLRISGMRGWACRIWC